MKLKAAVSYGDSNFVIEDVFYEDIDPEELLISIKAVGICHTDISSTEGIYPFTYPVILGHEGAGIVDKVGENVKGIEEGDHVILTFAQCNSCEACEQGKPYICESFYRLNTHGVNYKGTKKIKLESGEKVSNFFGQSSFAEYALVHMNNVVKVPKDLPLEYLGPLACGIMTGFGAVLEKIKPKVNESIAVFGCGTVGLSSIIASKLAECKKIIAVDINEEKLLNAKKFGATHTINSSIEDVPKTIKEIEKNGVDYAIESTGIPSVLTQTVDCLKIPGMVVILSATKYGTKIEIDYKSIQTERQIVGTVMGSVNPTQFIPKLISLYRDKKLPLEEMITFFPFEKVNEAVASVESGQSIKAILKF
ncbi:NAD(P)-dependent alcohol dehydrogenase [Oceanobacillus damuensis]|uniref:NAD(P)-dependent alcohol dehydrogenase n=1 Tax=Oceanobacillus damuensis TaxID=937928 RepID=UPI00082CC706|nr:NAD(P)-dependent alcohol dehydrogenase [Oceanobacillus damuensis]